jgi:hypothetical protein
VAAAALGELLAREQSPERVAPAVVADIAAAAARPEYSRDEQLVHLTRRASELMQLREDCQLRDARR